IKLCFHHISDLYSSNECSKYFCTKISVTKITYSRHDIKSIIYFRVYFRCHNFYFWESICNSV
ncbi:hypothetical protein X975_01173, partial [Stegodyphus mimosarum]